MIHKYLYVCFLKETGELTAMFANYVNAEEFLLANKGSVNAPYLFDITIDNMDIVLEAKENLKLKPTKLGVK